MYGGLRYDVGVQAVAKVDGVDVVTGRALSAGNILRHKESITYHSRSLYMIVKKTCRNKLTAFISTANRYSHASPDIIFAIELPRLVSRVFRRLRQVSRRQGQDEHPRSCVCQVRVKLARGRLEGRRQNASCIRSNKLGG